MTARLTKVLSLSAAVAMTAALGACSTAANPVAMTVLPSTTTVATAQDYGYQRVRIVSVTGGKETNPLFRSDVSSDDFRQALEGSLNAVQYLGTADAPLQLSATLVEVRKPMVGLDLTVTSTVRYEVQNAQGQSVFDETISEAGKATVSESFSASDRLRLANEKSIRNNIKSFIEQFRAKTQSLRN